MPARKQNHYEILGLWRDASEAEIRRAYRRLAMLHHPDVSSDPGADKSFRAIKEAYDVLSEPAARARFDASLGASTAAPRRSDAARDHGVPGGWTPPWVRDWRAEAWLRENAGPPPWSLRALGAEMRRSWKTLVGYFAVLALGITVCALLDWAIPVLGTVVVVSVFVLPFFAYIPYVFRWLGMGDEPYRRGRRERRSSPRSCNAGPTGNRVRNSR